MLVHKLTTENAEALKSQTNQIHQDRSVKAEGNRKTTKKRRYKKDTAQSLGALQVVIRLDNHMRQTHKIMNDKVFKKLLKEALVYEELKTESETDYSEPESESEYQVFRKLMKRGGARYLKRIKADIIDSDDSSDEDWLLKDVIGKHFKRSKFQWQ